MPLYLIQAPSRIEDQSGDKLGASLYDPQGDSFRLGNWIIKDGAPKNVTIESAFMIYACAIDYLGFKQVHSDVGKGNSDAWRFYERFGVARVEEAKRDYHYRNVWNEDSATQQHYKNILLNRT